MKIDKAVQGEIDYYSSLPCVFERFWDVPALSDGITTLVCVKKHHKEFYEKRIPTYEFDICTGDDKVGSIRLRIGFSEAVWSNRTAHPKNHLQEITKTRLPAGLLLPASVNPQLGHPRLDKAHPARPR